MKKTWLLLFRCTEPACLLWKSVYWVNGSLYLHLIHKALTNLAATPTMARYFVPDNIEQEYC